MISLAWFAQIAVIENPLSMDEFYQDPNFGCKCHSMSLNDPVDEYKLSH